MLQRNVGVAVVWCPDYGLREWLVHVHGREPGTCKHSPSTTVELRSQPGWFLPCNGAASSTRARSLETQRDRPSSYSCSVAQARPRSPVERSDAKSHGAPDEGAEGGRVRERAWHSKGFGLLNGAPACKPLPTSAPPSACGGCVKTWTEPVSNSPTRGASDVSLIGFRS